VPFKGDSRLKKSGPLTDHCCALPSPASKRGSAWSSFGLRSLSRAGLSLHEQCSLFSENGTECPQYQTLVVDECSSENCFIVILTIKNQPDRTIPNITVLKDSGIAILWKNPPIDSRRNCHRVHPHRLLKASALNYRLRVLHI